MFRVLWSELCVCYACRAFTAQNSGLQSSYLGAHLLLSCHERKDQTNTSPVAARVALPCFVSLFFFSSMLKRRLPEPGYACYVDVGWGGNLLIWLAGWGKPFVGSCVRERRCRVFHGEILGKEGPIASSWTDQGSWWI